MTGRLPCRDKEIGNILPADRLLHVPHHPGQEVRQVVRTENQRVVVSAQLAGHSRGVNQLPVIRSVSGTEGVDLFAGSHMAYAPGHDG